MHELSVAMSLIEAVEEEAQKHEGKVTAVHLRLGPLSGVIKDALLSAYGLACEGTTVSAPLIIEEVPIVVYCDKCKGVRTVASMQWICCPDCETPALEIIHGKELELVALEME